MRQLTEKGRLRKRLAAARRLVEYYETALDEQMRRCVKAMTTLQNELEELNRIRAQLRADQTNLMELATKRKPLSNQKEPA